MIGSISSTALAGFQSGLKQAASSAERAVIAFQPKSKEDPVGPLIDLRQAEHQVQASAKLAKVGDELLGTILDIFA